MEAQQMNSDIVSAPSVVCYPWASKLSTQSSWEAALLRGRPEGPAAFHRFPRPSWDKKHPWFEKRQNQVGGANYDTGGRKVKFNCQIPGPFVGIMVQYIKTYTHARAHTRACGISNIFPECIYSALNFEGFPSHGVRVYEKNTTSTHQNNKQLFHYLATQSQGAMGGVL